MRLRRALHPSVSQGRLRAAKNGGRALPTSKRRDRLSDFLQLRFSLLLPRSVFVVPDDSSYLHIIAVTSLFLFIAIGIPASEWSVEFIF